MLDLIKAEVQTSQIAEIVEALDVRDEVIVEIQLGQIRGDARGNIDTGDLILAEAQSLRRYSALHFGSQDSSYDETFHT